MWLYRAPGQEAWNTVLFGHLLNNLACVMCAFMNACMGTCVCVCTSSCVHVHMYVHGIGEFVHVYVN